MAPTCTLRGALRPPPRSRTALALPSATGRRPYPWDKRRTRQALPARQANRDGLRQRALMARAGARTPEASPSPDGKRYSSAAAPANRGPWRPPSRCCARGGHPCTWPSPAQRLRLARGKHTPTPLVGRAASTRPRAKLPRRNVTGPALAHRWARPTASRRSTKVALPKRRRSDCANRLSYVQISGWNSAGGQAAP